MNLSTKQTYRTGLRLPGGLGDRGVEFGVSRCKLLYTEWITRFYCTAQKTAFNIPLQTTMEKNIKKRIICITESLCCTAEINTINYI